MSASNGFRPNVKEFDCREPGALVDRIASVGGDLSPLELIELGAVYINETRILNPAQKVQVGDQIRVHASPRRFEVPTDLEARVVDENEERVVVEKPAGLPSEATVDNFTENLVSAFSDLRGQSFHLVNSLEAESSGLVVLATSLDSQREWKRAFAEERIKRRFNVFTEASLTPGPYSGFEVTSCEEFESETNSITDSRAEWKIDGESIAKYFKIDLVMTSGRPAQLRDALAKSGAPVLGDRKNGSRLTLVDAKTGRSTMAIRQTGF